MLGTILVILLILLLIGALPRWAIEGRVIDCEGRPAKLAWVRFVPLSKGEVRQTITDFDGAFDAPWTTDVDYDVRVLFRDPKRLSNPGDSMGVFHGGARGVVLRLSRGK